MSSNTWIENAIKDQHIQLFNYNDFRNKIKCGEGGLGKINCADWQYSDRKVALKELFDYNVQKFVQEVNYLIATLKIFFLTSSLFIIIDPCVGENAYLMSLE